MSFSEVDNEDCQVNSVVSECDLERCCAVSCERTICCDDFALVWVYRPFELKCFERHGVDARCAGAAVELVLGELFVDSAPAAESRCRWRERVRFAC